MSAFDRRVDPEVREVRRLEVITGALANKIARIAWAVMRKESDYRTPVAA
jgi:hypothetical protein